MAEKINLKDKAYGIIKDKIIHCEYKPGEFLIEAELMNVVGASRTPIREALNKLEQEGYIDILPKKGVMVRNITIAELNEIYEVRFLVEPYIIRNYGNLVPKQLLLELRESLKFCSEGDSTYHKDEELHDMLVRISQNTYLMELLNRLYAQNHRLRVLSGSLLSYRNEETIKEHEAILDALLNKNYEQAAQAMQEHLQNSKDASMNIMINSKLGVQQRFRM